MVCIHREAKAKTIEQAAHQHGGSLQSIYRWKCQFGKIEVTDVRKRRDAAKAACARELRIFRSTGLCSIPRSGQGYTSQIIRQNARLRQALRGMDDRYPQ